MIYYIIAVLLLSLLLWRWRQKATVIVLCCLAAFVLIIVGTIISDTIREKSVATIPCVAVNYALTKRSVRKTPDGGVEVLSQGKWIPSVAKTVSKEEMVEHALQNGFLGKQSMQSFSGLEDTLFGAAEFTEYYIDNALYTNSFFLQFLGKCADTDDVCILISNTTESTLSNEKLKLSARVHHHSTEVLDASEKDAWEDLLILPGKTAFICKKFSSLGVRNAVRENIVFDARLKAVHFER